MKIYSGSSNPTLAAKISQSSGIPLGKIELSRFQNRETRVRILDQVPESVILVQSFSIPTDHHIIEFCLIADALKRQGAVNIIAVIPYFGYSKQDKVFRPGEPLSVKVVASLIETTPVKKIITLDLHNPAIAGFFDTPLTNLKAMQLFSNHFKAQDLSHRIVVSPDAGAIKTSSEFAHVLDLPIAFTAKHRDLDTGQVTITGLDQSINGSHALVLDDMVVTGSTMLALAGYLKSHGAKSVSVAATHHLYLDGIQSAFEASSIDAVITTDSIAPPTNLQSQKLTILSVDSLIAPLLVPVLK